MELTWARGEGRRPRWPRDSQIISFHPLRGQASIRLTRNSPTPSSPSPSLPCRPTATVHRQKIISNRDTGADFSNAVDPNGSRANAWREIFFFSFFLVLSFCFFFFRREEERWMDLEIGGGFEPCAHHLHRYTAWIKGWLKKLIGKIHIFFLFKKLFANKEILILMYTRDTFVSIRALKGKDKRYHLWK